MNIIICVEQVQPKVLRLAFERTYDGIKCLVYEEDCVTKTHDGGLNDFRKDRKEVWVFPSENINRCPCEVGGEVFIIVPELPHKK